MRVPKITLSSGLARVVLVAGIAAISGCGSSAGPQPLEPSPAPAMVTSPAPPAATSAASPVAPELAKRAAEAYVEQVPTDAEAQAFAASLEKVLATGDAKAIDAVIDLDAILHRAMSGFDYPQDLRQAIVAGTKAKSTTPSGLASSLARIAAGGSHFRLLHVGIRDGQQRAVFRLSGENKQLDYFEWIFVRGRDGKVRIGDWYQFGSGELMSAAMRLECLCLACQQQPALNMKLPQAERDYVGHAAEIDTLRQLAVNGRVPQALAAFDGLPASVKSMPHMLRLRLACCLDVPDKFDAALLAFRTAVPNDAGADLMLMPYWAAHQRTDEFLACVERIDKSVGGDPLLDARRALAHVDKGDLAAAKQCYENALAAEPNDFLVQLVAKEIAVAEKNAAELAASLKPPDPGQPAGDDEAKAFAAALEKAMMSHDEESVRTAIDSLALCRRAIAKLDLRPLIRAKVEAGADKIGSGLAKSLTETDAEQGERVKFLHLRRDGEEQWAIFRQVDKDDNLGYCDFLLVRHGDGKVRVDDVYGFQSGELASASLGRMFSALFAPEGAAPSPTTAKVDVGRLSSALSQIESLVKEHKYQEALIVYQSFSAELQADKSALSARIIAARGVKGKPYEEAVLAYRKLFRDERNMDLIMVGAYFDHQRYDRALAAIDAVDKTVGGDPYLNTLRAEAYFLRGEKADLSMAKSLARKSLAAVGDVPATYLLLSQISLKEKKYADTSTILTTIHKRFPSRMPALETDPAYADYLRSPQYRTLAKAKKP